MNIYTLMGYALLIGWFGVILYGLYSSIKSIIDSKKSSKALEEIIEIEKQLKLIEGETAVIDEKTYVKRTETIIISYWEHDRNRFLVKRLN